MLKKSAENSNNEHNSSYVLKVVNPFYFKSYLRQLGNPTSAVRSLISASLEGVPLLRLFLAGCGVLLLINRSLLGDLDLDGEGVQLRLRLLRRRWDCFGGTLR